MGDFMFEKIFISFSFLRFSFLQLSLLLSLLLSFLQLSLLLSFLLPFLSPPFKWDFISFSCLNIFSKKYFKLLLL